MQEAIRLRWGLRPFQVIVFFLLLTLAGAGWAKPIRTEGHVASMGNARLTPFRLGRPQVRPDTSYPPH